MARAQTGGGTMRFPNGSVVVATETADTDGATPPTYSNFSTAYVVTAGPNGELPSGFPDAFPGGTISP